MRIMIASGTDSGIVRGRSELINELLDMKHEVVIVTPAESGHDELKKMGCSFVEMHIRRHGMNPFVDWKLLINYLNVLKSIHPDVVLTFTTKPNVFCGIACRKLGIPAIMNITGMGSALGNKGPVQKLLVSLYKLACNGSNLKRLFFQNDDSMDFFDANCIGDKRVYYRVPGSGVNLDKYQVQPFPESDTVDFLFVARVMKAKGIEEYIEAAKNVRKTHPEAVFHVLGGCNEEYKEILAEETRKGSIIYHGRVNNIPEFEKLSQCTIQPSYYPEGMSNVILEAAASGRPVITTDHPGCREGVDNKITGYIVPIKDSNALIKAIESFLGLSVDQRREMGIQGRMKMEREFDRNIVTDAYLRSIETLKQENA